MTRQRTVIFLSSPFFQKTNHDYTLERLYATVLFKYSVNTLNSVEEDFQRARIPKKTFKVITQNDHTVELFTKQRHRR